jgi:hypothetical protein
MAARQRLTAGRYVLDADFVVGSGVEEPIRDASGEVVRLSGCVTRLRVGEIAERTIACLVYRDAEVGGPWGERRV